MKAAANNKQSVRRLRSSKDCGEFQVADFSNFFTLTLILLAVSLVVHASLYAGFNTRDHFPFVWRFLQYAVVIGFIPKAVSYLSRRLGIIRTILVVLCTRDIKSLDGESFDSPRPFAW